MSTKIFPFMENKMRHVPLVTSNTLTFWKLVWAIVLGGIIVNLITLPTTLWVESIIVNSATPTSDYTDTETPHNQGSMK
jgi:hypothetical protein